MFSNETVGLHWPFASVDRLLCWANWVVLLLSCQKGWSFFFVDCVGNMWPFGCSTPNRGGSCAWRILMDGVGGPSRDRCDCMVRLGSLCQEEEEENSAALCWCTSAAEVNMSWILWLTEEESVLHSGSLSSASFCRSNNWNIDEHRELFALSLLKALLSGSGRDKTSWLSDSSLLSLQWIISFCKCSVQHFKKLA